MKGNALFSGTAATAFTVRDKADLQQLRAVVERAIREGTPAGIALVRVEANERDVLAGIDEAALSAVCIQVVHPSPLAPQRRRRGEA